MKMKKRFLPILLALGTGLAVAGEDIPTRPEQLTYSELKFDLPAPDQFQVKLKNNISAYIAEDRMLPLVSIQAYFSGGKYLEPEGKEGLAGLTARVWRTGGAGQLDAKALDEELDFLAARLSTGIGDTSGSISLNLLAKDLDRGLELLMLVLNQPRFDEERLQKAKEDLLASMKERNDNTSSIEGREWDRLIYGDDFWLNRLPTQPSVESITREDLIQFHKRLTGSREMVLAVAGDVDREILISKLNATFGELIAEGASVPPVPQPTSEIKPGVYLVNKPDVNQGRVSIGHLGLKRPVEQEFDILIANDVLGGGGFTSWITTRVRSDEGLAYSAGSSFGVYNTYPGSFRAAFQSKFSTCALAAELIVDLVKKMRSEGMSEKELTTSKNSFIETFPTIFSSRLQTVALYAQDDLLGRDHDYWLTYRDKVRTVSQESSRAAAERYLDPNKLVILVVGNVEEVLKGHPDHPEAKFESLGEIIRVPLKDPMTLLPIEE